MNITQIRLICESTAELEGATKLHSVDETGWRSLSYCMLSHISGYRYILDFKKNLMRTELTFQRTPANKTDSKSDGLLYWIYILTVCSI